MRRMLSQVSTILVLIALTAGTAMGSGGAAVQSVGARSAGMGLAYRALSNDYSGGYWNPAGLAFATGHQLGFGMGLIMPSATLTPNSYPGFKTAPVDIESKVFPIPSFGLYFHNEDMGMTYGIGMEAPFGLGPEWDLFELPEGYGNVDGLPDKNEFFGDLKVIGVHPTIAKRFGDSFSLGLSANIMLADIIIKQLNFIPNAVLDNPLTAGYYDEATALAQKNIVASVALEGEGIDGIGYGATVGATYKPTEKLTFGASMRWYNDIPLEGEVTLIAHMPYNEKANKAIGGLIGSPFISDSVKAVLRTALAVTSGQDIALYDKRKIDADFPLPMNIGIGVAYQASPRLLLAADVDITKWTAWDVIELNVADTTDVLELVEHWDDILQISLGGEYLAYESGDSQLFLRAGYYTHPTPIPDKTMTPQIPDPNRRHTAALGLSYKTGGMGFDLVFENLFYGNKDITQQTEDNIAGAYEANVLVLTGGLSMSF